MDLTLDGIQTPDPIGCFGGDRRGHRHIDLIEVTTHMIPTSGFLDPLTVQALEAGTGISLQNPCEGGQVRSWTLALAVRRVPEIYRRRLAARRCSIVTDVRPQPTLFGRTSSGAKHRHRCIVTVDLLSTQHVTAQRSHQRLKQRTRLTHPITQG